MLIEIVDRKHWSDQTDTAISGIHSFRQKQTQKEKEKAHSFKTYWDSQNCWRYFWSYPKFWEWPELILHPDWTADDLCEGDMKMLSTLKRSLKCEFTGTITISDAESRTINYWSKVRE